MSITITFTTTMAINKNYNDDSDNIDNNIEYDMSTVMRMIQINNIILNIILIYINIIIINNQI